MFEKTFAARAFKGHTLTTCVIAATTALALSFAAVTPGAAATHHKAVRAQSTNTNDHAVVEGDPPPGMSAAQVGHRINPMLPGGNGFGPPDPASCGGFSC